MNKKRLGSLSMRHWAMLFALAVLTAAYATLSESPSLMAAVTTRELPVYNVDTEEKVLSVSFDAAWGADSTDSIIDTLEKYNVKTTFFVVGKWAEQYPDKVKKLSSPSNFRAVPSAAL